MKLDIFCFTLILTSLLQGAFSSKILFLLPVASKSHVHVFEPMIKALADRGHQITNLSPVNSSGMPPNVKQIVAITISEIFKTMQNQFEMRKLGKFAGMLNISTDYLDNACNVVYENDQVQDMLKNEKFDLVIVDILMNYCMLGMLPHFKAPYIYVTTMVAPSFTTEPLGNRLPPSFVPSPFLEFSDRMTFRERTVNLVFNFFIDLYGYFLFLPKFERIYQNKLNITDKIQDIHANVSMVMMNSHFTLTYPRPLLPDVVEIGGMHTKPAKPLPQDLEDFLAGAGDDGFIFFSLGSIVQAKDMPEEYRKIFLNVFSRLKQRVIWKWETETMPDLPKNVKLSKWLPQQDILGHKNIRLFMTHGGLLSTQETLYHAVPLIGIPLFADQDLNVKQAEKAGFSLTLEILDMTEELLESKIKTIIENPKFAQRAKELSTLWRDQPQTPLENAVYWTEYIIRHKGALHMRSSARDLNFLQYHSIDIIAFILICITCLSLVFKFLIVLTYRKLRGKVNNIIKQKQKKN